MCPGPVHQRAREPPVHHVQRAAEGQQGDGRAGRVGARGEPEGQQAQAREGDGVRGVAAHPGGCGTSHFLCRPNLSLAVCEDDKVVPPVLG